MKGQRWGGLKSAPIWFVNDTARGVHFCAPQDSRIQILHEQ